MKNCADLSGSMRRFSLKHSFIFLNWNWLPPSLIICCLISLSLCLHISTEKKIFNFKTDKKFIKYTPHLKCEVIHKISVRSKLMSFALGAFTNYVRNFLLPDRLHVMIFPFFGRHKESKLGNTVTLYKPLQKTLWCKFTYSEKNACEVNQKIPSSPWGFTWNRFRSITFE